MKLTGHNVQVDFTPLQLSGSLNVEGGSVVQFYDGESYIPNREGTPSSPILITHNLSSVNPDTAVAESKLTKTTTFYENDSVISASTSGYELLPDGVLKVKKNIPAGTAVAIKAFTKAVDSRDGKLYEREDTLTLRTLLKSAAQYQLVLSQRGAIYFDGYRNPNVTTTVTATLKQGATEVTNLRGITLKWLNAAGLNAVENELYADMVSADGKTLTVDKTYIDQEVIVCEAWRGSELLAAETVTFIRKFNSFRFDVRVPELPLLPGVNTLNCSILVTDMLGNVDADKAFSVHWMVSENGIERQVATGAEAQIPLSAINMKAANLAVFPVLFRGEAFAALTTADMGEFITDEADNVLTVETYGL